MRKDTDKISRIAAIAQRLAAADVDGATQLLSPDARWTLVRPREAQPVIGREKIGAYLRKVAAEAPGDTDIRIEKVASDGDTVFTQHVEAPGTPREHRHVLVYRFAGDAIAEIWELTLGGPETEHGELINIDAA